jgi:hypothetical protein
VWDRAVTAAKAILGSEVVKLELVDPVQVTAAMPQVLWEIAEGLARLTQARARQQESLDQAAPGDPYIAAKVNEPGRQADARRQAHLRAR